MRNTKYQIKTPQGVTSIPKKNDFINQCQTYFNQSINSKKPVNISFSFDSGNEWYDIIHFKELRMTIQNEKTQVVTKESNETSKSATNSFSLVKVLVWSIAIYGLMMIVDKNFTNIPVFDKINSTFKEVFTYNIDDTNNNEDDDSHGISQENNKSIQKYSQSSISKLNQSEFIQVLKPNDYDRSLILNFLNKSIDQSQLNYSCNEHGVTCYYCNQLLNGERVSAVKFIQDNYIHNTFESMINTRSLKLYNNLLRESPSGEFEKAFNDVYKENGDKIRNDFYRIIRNNFDFICLPVGENYIGKEFCSKKCLSEYQYSN